MLFRSDVINGGPNSDSISIGESVGSRATDTVIVASNQSTNVSFDTISDFDVSSALTTGNTNDVLNLPSNAIAPDTAGIIDGAVNITASPTTVVFDKHSISNGIVTFYDTSNTPILVNNSSSFALKAGAITYLQNNLTTPGITAAFAFDSDGSGQTDSLVVYQDGVAPSSDLMVQLNGLNEIGRAHV